jgi:hypothetical protein
VHVLQKILKFFRDGDPEKALVMAIGAQDKSAPALDASSEDQSQWQPESGPQKRQGHQQFRPTREDDDVDFVSFVLRRLPSPSIAEGFKDFANMLLLIVLPRILRKHASNHICRSRTSGVCRRPRQQVLERGRF